jgi:hypothetical protein
MAHNTVAEEMPAAKAKPVHELRLGKVRAAIWANDTEFGARHNVTFSRLYREGEEWRSTESFGQGDLLLLAKVADLAHTWVSEQARSGEVSDG